MVVEWSRFSAQLTSTLLESSSPRVGLVVCSIVESSSPWVGKVVCSIANFFFFLGM